MCISDLNMLCFTNRQKLKWALLGTVVIPNVANVKHEQFNVFWSQNKYSVKKSVLFKPLADFLWSHIGDIFNTVEMCFFIKWGYCVPPILCDY